MVQATNNKVSQYTYLDSLKTVTHLFNTMT